MKITHKITDINTPKGRFKIRLRSGITLLILGLLYYGFTKLTGWGLPCLLNKVFHIYCPGCGVTRMFVALFQGDIKTAAGYNLFVLVFLIPALIFALVRLIRYVKKGITQYNKIEMALLFFTFFCAVAFTVMRNLPQFSFFAP